MPDSNSNTPADDKQGGAVGTAGTGTPDPKSEPKKLDLTQEDLDRIIAERVARAVPKDYAELQKMKERVDAEEEAKKPELQKEKDARLEAERKAKEKDSKANAKLKRAAILAEATAQNAADADIVVALLVGSDDIAVDDDGEVTGVKDAVKKLLKDKPVLVKATTTKSGGEFGGNDQATLDERIREAESKKDWATSRRLKLAKLGR